LYICLIIVLLPAVYARLHDTMDLHTHPPEGSTHTLTQTFWRGVLFFICCFIDCITL